MLGRLVRDEMNKRAGSLDPSAIVKQTTEVHNLVAPIVASVMKVYVSESRVNHVFMACRQRTPNDYRNSRLSSDLTRYARVAGLPTIQLIVC